MNKKGEYNSLEDVNLAHHFRKPSVFHHLVRMGLVTPTGRIVPDREWRRAQRSANTEKTRNARRRSLVPCVSEGNLRPRREITKQPWKPNKSEGSLPFPVFPNRIGISGEPYLMPYFPTISHGSKQGYLKSTASNDGLTKQRVWDRLCPTPPSINLSTSSLRGYRVQSARIRIKYTGRKNSSHLTITQQPSGSYSIPIYDRVVSSGEVFELVSCRNYGCPLSLVIYEEGICSRRINACCEKKYPPGKKIRCFSGQFLILENKGGQPCSKCFQSSTEEFDKEGINLKTEFQSMQKGESKARHKKRVLGERKNSSDPTTFESDIGSNSDVSKSKENSSSEEETESNSKHSRSTNSNASSEEETSQNSSKTSTNSDDQTGKSHSETMENSANSLQSSKEKSEGSSNEENSYTSSESQNSVVYSDSSSENSEIMDSET